MDKFAHNMQAYSLLLLLTIFATQRSVYAESDLQDFQAH